MSGPPSLRQEAHLHQPADRLPYLPASSAWPQMTGELFAIAIGVAGIGIGVGSVGFVLIRTNLLLDQILAELRKDKP